MSINVKELLNNDYITTLTNDIEQKKQQQQSKSKYHEKLLDISNLEEYLKNHIIIGSGASFVSKLKDKRNKYKTNINRYYLPIDCKQIDQIVQIQAVLALNPFIPIALIKDRNFNPIPYQIRWADHVFSKLGRDSNFKCTCCNNSITLEKTDQSIYYPDCLELTINTNYKSRTPSKLLTVYKLIECEIKNEIKYGRTTPQYTVINVYDSVVNKYNGLLPSLNMHFFKPAAAITSLRKWITNTNKLKSQDVADFFTNRLDSIIQQYHDSPIMQIMLMNDLLYSYQDNNLVITKKSTLEIFYNAFAGGGDGTFAIVPKFLQVATGYHRTLHYQVFKIYAFYQYTSKTKKKEIVSYPIAFALLSGRDTEAYEWMFTVILNWGKKYNLIKYGQLQQYICDFEKAQRNGWSNVFQSVLGTIILGETFHFTHCIYKNVTNNSLRKYYQCRQNSQNYDATFREYMEMLYNLIHLIPDLVKIYGIIIIQHLWSHVSINYVSGDTKLRFLLWIEYFMIGWLECKRKDVFTLLALDRQTKNKMRQEKPNGPTRIAKITEWNVNGAFIKTSNPIESDNKHHRKKMGYYPTIDAFFKSVLQILDETIRSYNYYLTNPIVSIYKSKARTTKTQLLNEYAGKSISFKEYQLFSSKLTRLKYRLKNKDIHKYFDKISSDYEHNINTRLFDDDNINKQITQLQAYFKQTPYSQQTQSVCVDQIMISEYPCTYKEQTTFSDTEMNDIPILEPIIGISSNTIDDFQQLLPNLNTFTYNDNVNQPNNTITTNNPKQYHSQYNTSTFMKYVKKTKMKNKLKKRKQQMESIKITPRSNLPRGCNTKATEAFKKAGIPRYGVPASGDEYGSIQQCWLRQSLNAI